MPVLHRCFDGETAHRLSVLMVKNNLLPVTKINKDLEATLVSIC